MGELQSALDALAAEDLTSMVGPQLLERLAPLLHAQNRIAAEVARTVRQCELTGAAEHDGLTTMQSWLRGHGHLADAEAARLVSTGRALEHLPAVAAGFADGTITAGQVGLIARIAEPDRLAAAADSAVDVGEIDRALAATAAAAPHATVKQAVGHYLACLDPDGPEPDPTEGRSLTISKHADGSRSLRGQLDAVGGEKLEAALESIVQADRPKGDTRTRAQQLADALVQLADNALASGTLPFLRTVKPHVVVTIDHDDLADNSTGPGAAETGFGGRISAARARWLACDATVSRMVMGPNGLPLDVGREKRVVPPHIRRAVEHRDRHCVFASCGAPTHWCDVHHPATSRGPRRACESWKGGGPFAHEGAPRVPGRARSRRAVAHPPPRRNRDPHRTSPPALTRPRAVRVRGEGSGKPPHRRLLPCPSTRPAERAPLEVHEAPAGEPVERGGSTTPEHCTMRWADRPANRLRCPGPAAVPRCDSEG